MVIVSKAVDISFEYFAVYRVFNHSCTNYLFNSAYFGIMRMLTLLVESIYVFILALIKIALILFPILAFVITIPYMIVNYRKYGFGE